VLTGHDFLADGLNPIPFLDRGNPADLSLKNRDGSSPLAPLQLPIAIDEARHLGEIAAIIVGETLAMAKGAAELVAVAWEALPSVARAVDAARPGAPRARRDVPANTALDAELGDPDATAAAFARATHIVRLDTQIQRIAGVPMEPRGDRRLRCDERPLHALCRDGRCGAASRRSRRGARRRRRKCARRYARCRRQFRHARRLQPGIRPRRVGGAAGRPPG
jgi:hypothetical protein